MKRIYGLLFSITLVLIPVALIIYAPFLAIIYLHLATGIDFIIFTLALIIYTLILIPILGTAFVHYLDKLDVKDLQSKEDFSSEKSS